MMDSIVKQVAIVAAGQFGVITRRQLLELGLSRSAIATWVRHGRVTPLHRGVYLVGAVLPPLGAEKAAVLACGPRSVLSHWSAAHVMALPDCPPAREPQLIVPLGGSSGRPGIRIYRTDSLLQSEVRQVRGLPVTTSSRTLLDLAATLARAGDTRRLERLVAASLDEGLVTEAALRDVARRHASQKGAGLLMDVLAEPGGPRLTRSEAERLLLELLDETELPRPQTNVWIARFRVDFHWPLEGLVVEVDGRRFHSSRNRFEGDRDRDGTLLAAGCTVLRFTWSQLVERPKKVIARIGYMLGRLGALRSVGAAVTAPAPIQRHN